jgi:hypothetical protein
MKKILALILLASFALNAMDATKKSEPEIIEIYPTFQHARADKNQKTVQACSIQRDDEVNDTHPESLFSPIVWIGAKYRDIEVKILETIPNDETQFFTLLYSIKKNTKASPSLGVINEKYGTWKVPLSEINGVQYFLRIPELGEQCTQPGTIRPPVKSEDLSDDARTFLALFAQAPANTNNNNNQ